VARTVLVVNGPNLNLLGTREPAQYGSRTLAEVERDIAQAAAALGLSVQTFQSNHEGALIDRVQGARSDGTDFIIINAGGFTHTSVALRDALAAVAIPFVEVHISNLHRRERFRHRSLLSDLAVGSIVGLGTTGYRLALEFAAGYNASPAASPA
jgi:3-dehydroquinate dehydratase-2